MRVPVLAYHAANITGNDYVTNDHVAFASDLRLIGELGLRVVPLAWVVDQLTGAQQRDLNGCVALTCDDGTDLDFVDVEHPQFGLQRSFYNLMLDHLAAAPTPQPDLHLTCFVIASVQARTFMDRNCLFGKDWMNDTWWNEAQRSGRIAIENHSLDHNHAQIPLPGIDGMERGSFFPVDSTLRADAEIADAARLIDDIVAPHRTTLFCYPYGHVNEFLPREYFPQNPSVARAAFGDGAQPVTMQSDRWNVPRYICGWHWKSPDALRAILQDAANAV